MQTYLPTKVWVIDARDRVANGSLFEPMSQRRASTIGHGLSRTANIPDGAVRGTQVCMQSRCLDRLGLFCCHRRDCSGQQHRRGQRRHIQHRPYTPDRRWTHRWALHSGTGRFVALNACPRLPALRALGRATIIATSASDSLCTRPAAAHCRADLPVAIVVIRAGYTATSSQTAPAASRT